MPNKTRPRKVLILGGTSDAVEIAARMVAEGHDVTSSLAGVTTAPVLPEGKIRRGGFGGAEGLAHYLREEGVELLIDATHPYAVQISAHTVFAAQAVGVELIRFERPQWEVSPDWIVVADIAEAARVLPSAARVFLTTGRKEIAPFVAREDISGVMRMIEPPAIALTSRWALLKARPAQSVDEEVEVMRVHQITHLVSKNSGGLARHKLEAAAILGVTVVMVARPLRS
jgi:precorrin-6A/cobalt-precorrin-6A reductase